MKITTWLYTFIALSFTTYCNSQNLKWEGRGNGLSHIKIFEKTIKVQTIRDAFEEEYNYFPLKSGELILFKGKANLDEKTSTPSIKFIDIHKDTLVLKYKTQEFIFISFDSVNYKQKVKFNSLVYEHLNPYKQVKSRIEFNHYGLLRTSDHKNKTMLEVEVSLKEIEKFNLIISKLDIKNIYATERWMNICDDDEFSFTFIDSNGKRYNYTSTEIRESLKPVYHYINALVKTYKK